MGLRIGGVPGFDDEQKGGRGTRTFMGNENENENEKENGNAQKPDENDPKSNGPATVKGALFAISHLP